MSGPAFLSMVSLLRSVGACRITYSPVATLRLLYWLAEAEHP